MLTNAQKFCLNKAKLHHSTEGRPEQQGRIEYFIKLPIRCGAVALISHIQPTREEGGLLHMLTAYL